MDRKKKTPEEGYFVVFTLLFCHTVKSNDNAPNELEFVYVVAATIMLWTEYEVRVFNSYHRF